MKKNILSIIPLSLAFLLAGCGAGGGSAVEEKPVDAGTIRDKVVKITLKTSGSQQQVSILERYAEGFKSVEPNVRVTVEQVGGSYKGIAETTLSELQTEFYGDLVIMYPDAIASCMEQGVCYDLTPYIENETYGLGDDYDDYIPEYLEEGKKYVREGIFSMPFQKSTEVMFYNAEVLDNVTIPGANNDKPITADYFNDITWEKFFTEFCPAVDNYCKTHPDFIKKDGDSGYSILGIDSDDNMFITLAEQYGLPYTSVNTTTNEGSYDFNTKEMQKIMQTWQSYKAKNWVISQGTIGKDRVRPNNLFTKKQCLLTIGSTAGIKYHWDENAPLTVIPTKIPHAADHDAKVISQGPSMAFLRHKTSDNKWDKHRQLASWLFYKYMTSSELATDWAINAKYLPIRTTSALSDAYKEYTDPSKIEEENSYEALFARTVQLINEKYDESEFFTSPAFSGSQKCRNEVKKLFRDCLNSDGTEAKISALFDAALNEVRV